MLMSLRRVLASSLGFWVLLAGVAIYLLYPPQKKLSFGADLAGGTYLTLGVHTHEAVEYELKTLVQSALKGLKKTDNIEPKSIKIDAHDMSVHLVFSNAGEVIKAQHAIEEYYSARNRSARDLQFNALGGDGLTVSFSDKKAAQIKQAALETNKQVLQTRLNYLGIEDIPVYIEEGKVPRIAVELPNVHDSFQAKKMIGTPAVLEFRLVEEGPARSEEEIKDKFGGEIPEGMEILKGIDRHVGTAYYLVPNYSDVSGRYLIGAEPRIDATQVVVGFHFNAEGGEKFHELTAPNIGRTLAAIIDKKVISAAKINDAIGAEGYIRGDFSKEEAQELASMLKSGAFVASVTIEEERHIDPTLGSESVWQGLISCLIGLLLLFLFAVLYYKLAGLFAFSAILYNLLMQLLLLSLLHATLTLPGIAGIVLTLGMGIDSSILVFEKTKELLAQGMAVAQAVREGFKDALPTILDANITTFLVAVVLYKFGTGPVRGFAVTMMIGILTTLLSGLLVLRSIFEAWLSRKHMEKLSI